MKYFVLFYTLLNFQLAPILFVNIKIPIDNI